MKLSVSVGQILMSVLLANSLFAFAPVASASDSNQSLATTVKKTKEPVSDWSTTLSYGFLTDLSDTRSSRTYSNEIGGELEYRFLHNWSATAGFGLSAETVDGEVSKGPQDSQTDVLNPHATFGAGYHSKIFKNDMVDVSTFADIPMDAVSKQEGYMAVIGAQGDLVLRFFGGRYSITQVLGGGEVENTYMRNSNGFANPDYFFDYKIANGLKIYKGLGVKYTFGIKTTHHMDDFWSYGYSNTIALVEQWKNLTVSLGYENGGYTDDGQVRLWFIDEYRRIVKASIAYTF